MERVSYKTLKNWLETDSLYSQGGFKLDCYNGYYHIKYNHNGYIIVCQKTPKKTWEDWNVFKAGVRFARGIYN